MKRRGAAFLTTFCLMISLLGGIVLPARAADMPYARDLSQYPEERTFAVAAQEDLEVLAELVNGGMSMENYTFLQTADITLTGAFTPIGQNPDNASDPNFTNSFKGTYNGQKYTISNLTINLPEVNGVGLFGSCVSATLIHIGIESGSVTGANRVGGIAGYADNCTVINCYNKADITGLTNADGVGGIAGVARNSAEIYGCFNLGTITAPMAAGGICGWGGTGNSITIRACYSGGSIVVDEEESANPTADVICRNKDRVDGDFSDSYYLAGICDDQYNNLNAVKLTEENPGKMAYIMNWAQGEDSGAFTVDASGALIFADEEHPGVVVLNRKVWQSGVLLERGLCYLAAGEGYEVPASHNGAAVDYALCGGVTYRPGAVIASAGSQSVDLYLAGSFPSVSEAESRPDSAVYTVGSLEELEALAELVNGGMDFAGKTVYLTADLDFSGKQTWTPIGLVTGSSGGAPSEGSLAFSGTFDGQYHRLENMDLAMTGDYQGLFAYIEGGAVRNLIFGEGEIHNDGRRDAVVCSLLRNGTITNIESHISLDTSHTALSLNMGLVALGVNATISGCVNYGEVGAEDAESGQENGGIVGYGFYNTTVKNCIVAGPVRGADSDVISRGCSTSGCYYLPSHEQAGTMSWERFFSGEAAWLLNTMSGTAAHAGLWSNSAEGPVLDPENAVYKLTSMLTDSYNELLGETTTYWQYGETVTFSCPDGYILDRVEQNGQTLPAGWTMLGEDARVVLYLQSKTYLIHYELNGGSFLTEPTDHYTAGYGCALPGSEAVEREGYSFLGWFDNAELEGEPVSVIPADQYYDATYYAAWVRPTEISTAEELAALATGDLAGSYILTADIDMSGIAAYQPIGTPDQPFTGNFDGNGYTVSDLTIDGTGDYQGLFGVNAGVIRNVTLEATSISGSNHVGGIAGSNRGTILNCVFEGEVISETPEDAEYKLMGQNLAVWGSDSLKPYMVERIRSNAPDVICYQEANPKWVAYLEENLPEYTLLYKYRGYPTEDEAVPLAFKTDRFEIVESGHFWINETPDEKAMGWDAGCLRICTWAVLRNKENGELIAAYSIHFDHQGETAREEGGKLIKSRIMMLQERYPGIVLFAAGDFNCGEGSPAYQALTTDGMGDARYLAAESSDLNTHSSIMTDGWEESSGRIDFITTYADAVEISKFDVLAETYDGKRPSDHNGLLATFTSVKGTRYGGIAGSNFGVVKNAVSEAYISGGTDAGLLIGQNSGETENLYYFASGDYAGVGTGDGESSALTAQTPEVVYQMNQAAGEAAFALRDNFIVAAGEAGQLPVRLTVNGAEQYALAGSLLELDTAGYVDPICTLDGLYFAGTSLTVPEEDAVITITENSACVEHDYSLCLPVDETLHRRVCSVNASHYFEEEHQFSLAETVEAGCGSAGYTVEVCTGCGYRKVTETQPAVGHSYGAWSYYNESSHRRVCGADESHVEYAAHDYSATYYPAACESYGYTRYTCVCGDYYDVIGEMKLRHDWGAPEEADQLHHYCVCSRDETHILALEHSYEATPVNATCESGGGIQYSCDVCGYSYVAVDTEPLGHQYGAWTAVDETYHQAVCAHDAHHVKKESHVFDEGVLVPAACGQQGYTRHTCATCGYYYDTDYTEALEHQWSAWQQDYPASGETAGRLHRTCALCSAVEYRVLPAESDPAVVATADSSEEGWMTVSVLLQNNPGLASLQLVLDYDTDQLQIESEEALVRGEALSGLLFGTGLSGHLNDGSFKATWVGAENDGSSGTLFTLRFRILEEGALRVGIRVVEDMAYNADCEAVCIYDRDLETTVHFHRFAWDPEKEAFVCSCGEERSAPGDPDGDGYLTTADAVLLLRYLNGWEGVLDPKDADFSGDGAVRVYDAVLILQLLAR